LKRHGVRCAAIAIGLVLLGLSPAGAGDRLTVAQVGSSTAWDFSVVPFGKRMGFFEKRGIDVEVATTDNAGANLQAVIAGSADIGTVAVTPFMAAAMKGAPLKMVSSAFKGTPDWLWYVRADSPIRSFKDITEKTTIGVTSTSSTSYFILAGLLTQFGVKATIVAAGTSAAIMTEVMTGQIDVGSDGNGLLGVPQMAAGEVRPVAYGRELDLLRGVTVKGLAVRSDTLRDRRDVIVRFLQAYEETVDWMYRDPQAVAWFAEQAESPLEDARRVKTDMYPDGAMRVGAVVGVDVSVRQGLQFKRLDRAPTDAEIGAMFEVVWTPAM
jgi:NitT/TauT family transport system substrate-binding protein